MLTSTMVSCLSATTQLTQISFNFGINLSKKIYNFGQTVYRRSILLAELIEEERQKLENIEKMKMKIKMKAKKKRKKRRLKFLHSFFSFNFTLSMLYSSF
jgi:hypothetical protein